ncbi:FtsB family cell division protein [Endozoicomonas numazuensis]|uniref:FtsB family cell division protein n=1 Tax=Endozoicomonas numazuensis TaxID=1137799 RepID=UPI000A5F8143|nr:hypothetical protein [Endozoicomonas numazuensis]
MQIEKQQAQIEQLLEENEQLRAEIRHLKKHKGKPKIRPNVPDDKDEQDSSASEEGTDQNSSSNGKDNSIPPKNKRPRSQQPGETAAPPLVADTSEILKVSDPQEVGASKAMRTSTILNSTCSLLPPCTGVSTTRHRKVLSQRLCRSILKGVWRQPEKPSTEFLPFMQYNPAIASGLAS